MRHPLGEAIFDAANSSTPEAWERLAPSLTDADLREHGKFAWKDNVFCRGCGLPVHGGKHLPACRVEAEMSRRGMCREDSADDAVRIDAVLRKTSGGG